MGRLSIKLRNGTAFSCVVPFFCSFMENFLRNPRAIRSIRILFFLLPCQEKCWTCVGKTLYLFYPVKSKKRSVLLEPPANLSRFGNRKQENAAWKPPANAGKAPPIWNIVAYTELVPACPRAVFLLYPNGIFLKVTEKNAPHSPQKYFRRDLW